MAYLNGSIRKEYQRMNCDCYVAKLPEHDRFMLRYGAHGLDCPVYRVSSDPVDRISDKIARAFYTEGRETWQR